MPRTPRPLAEQYRPSLIQLMSFKDSTQYQRDRQFTNEELATITPEVIVRWMCLKVYGMPDPSPNDRPTEGRSNSLEFAKKAISFFMPNRLMHWNQLATPPVGNPTKSAAVNDLIKRVKKDEVRKQGKPSQARKAFTEQEYELAIGKMDTHEQEEIRLFLAAIYRLQMSMVGRIDDTSKALVENLTPNNQHSEFSLLFRLCWSKNVHEERDAPQQILLGAQHPAYCVLIALSSWLETFISKGHIENTSFLFGIHGQRDPILIKEKATALMNQILNDRDLGNVIEGKRGTHSIRKFATTRARRNGCTKDDTDTRARWKQKRQQDTYADTILPWPDAKVAAALCKGGAIHYQLRSESGISEDWILTHVVPGIFSKYPRSLSLVLGRALLWTVFDENRTLIVPVSISSRVRNAYRDLGSRCTIPPGENPVQKVPLIVTGSDAEVHIDVLLEDDDVQQGQGVMNARPRRLDNEQLRHMNNLLIGLRRDNADLRAEIARIHERHERLLTRVNRNVTHLLRNPARRMQRQENNLVVENAIAEDREIEEQSAGSAVLSKCPRTLHTLWNEYEFGLGNRKAAKNFTAVERGRVKYIYHRRKVVWHKVAEMVRSGWSAHDACNRLYEVYGHNSTVTQIINRMRTDRKNGGHPELRMTHV